MRVRLLSLPAGLCLVSLTIGAALAAKGAPAQPDKCLDLRAPEAKVTLSGKLTAREFAGPPNYESIARGDAKETALILELPSPVCADDGEFIDGSTMVDRVHVSSHRPELLAILDKAKGCEVSVTGEAFGAFNAHHHAPLVLFADDVAVR